MFRKDGITYETEQEYQLAKQKTEPKKRTTADSIWLVIAVVLVLIVLFFVISAWSEGSPPA